MRVKVSPGKPRASMPVPPVHDGVPRVVKRVMVMPGLGVVDRQLVSMVSQ